MAEYQKASATDQDLKPKPSKVEKDALKLLNKKLQAMTIENGKLLEKLKQAEAKLADAHKEAAASDEEQNKLHQIIAKKDQLIIKNRQTIESSKEKHQQTLEELKSVKYELERNIQHQAQLETTLQSAGIRENKLIEETQQIRGKLSMIQVEAKEANRVWQKEKLALENELNVAKRHIKELKATHLKQNELIMLLRRQNSQIQSLRTIEQLDKEFLKILE